MAEQTFIRPRGRGAPFACKVAISTGGSNWPASPAVVSFLIVAWYSRDEHDFTACVPLNHYWQYDGAALAESTVSETGIINQAGDTTSSFAFSWSKPNGRQPDHYSIYYRTGATFGASAFGAKVLPSSGLVNGNIPGNATSALILNGTSRICERRVPVVSTWSDGVYIPGNCAASFEEGASAVTLDSVTGIANGNFIVDQTSVEWTIDGPVTKLELAGVSGVTPASQGGTARYDFGGLSLRTLPADGYRPLTFLSLENGYNLVGDDPCHRDFRGNLVPTAFLQDHPWRQLEFDVNFGGLYGNAVTAPSGEPGGLARLNTWARLGVEVELVDQANWSSASGSPSPVLARYFGTLTTPNNPGTSRRWGDSHRFALNIHGVKRLDDDRGFFEIQAVATGAGGSFTIDGDWTDLFLAGVGFYVHGSTNNDKSWAVASASYSAATNRTTIVVTGTVGATADGRIEVQDW